MVGAPVGEDTFSFSWGYNHFGGKLLSYGHFVKELWMLRRMEYETLVKTIEFS